MPSRLPLDELEPMIILKLHTRAAAHELKNVLGGMTLYLDLLEDERESVSELVAELRQSLELGVSATKRLMDVAAGAGDREVPVDPRLVLGELQRLSQDALPEDIGLTTSYPEELSTVRCDIVSIYSELGRLLAGAVTALPHGGTIAIKGEDRPGSPAEIVLAICAFAEDPSGAQVEEFLSRPLAEHPPDSEPESTAGSHRPAVVPGAAGCWYLRLPDRSRA